MSQLTLNVDHPNSIRVANGGYFDIANPTPDQVDLKGVAAALSKLCRFGGHTHVFYSVAEHCYWTTWLAQKDDWDNHELRCMLLHDASEAYIGDVVKPLKVMMPQYEAIESAVEQAVEEHFGIEPDHALVKRYDVMMYCAERKAIWPNAPYKPAPHVPFAFWSPPEAETRFLAMAEHLGIE